MNNTDKLKKVLDYLINIRYFATTVSKKTRDGLDENGVSCGESLYLILLNEHQEGLTMSELSSLIKVDKSLTTRIVKTLLSKEYIYKDTNDLNSRNYKIKLTDKGMEKANIIDNILLEKYDAFIDKFTEKEIKTLESAFNILMNKCSKDL